MKIPSALALAKIAFVVLLAPATAGAAEIKVLTGSGLRPVLDEMGPAFERSTKHKLAIAYSSTFATKRTIEAGEAFDVAILGTPAVADELVKQGKLAGRTVIACSGMGVAVREDAAKPAIDSTEAFKRALLSARSVAYNADGATAKHMATVFERLGIAAEMNPKMKAEQGAERALQSVATGQAELAVLGLSTILTSKGVQLAGPLPRELQDYVVYTAGINPNSKEPKASKALIDFLTGERATQVMKGKGLERHAH